MEKPSTSEPSPPSPTHSTTDAFPPTRSLAVLGAIALAFVAGQILNALITFTLLHTSVADARANHLTWGIVAGQFAGYLPILAVLLWAVPWAAGRPLRDVGLRWFDRRAIGAGLLGTLAMYAVTIGVAGIQFAVTHQKPEEAAISLFTSTHDAALIVSFTILATIAAPFMEEFVFRGFVFSALLRYMPVWIAATLSGIIFGIVHGSATAFLPLAASGIVLAYVYYRSGSLAASMLAHALFNLINVALLALGKT